MNFPNDQNTDRKMIQNHSTHFKYYDPEKQINVFFGAEAYKIELNNQFKDNTISTTKNNLLTWIPKSLFMQFLRSANIYFLIICILTLMDFSPKSPVSMIGTFAAVLVATMIKEGIEDLKRYQQDKEVNQKVARILNYNKNQYVEIKWSEIRVGDLIMIKKDEQIPADILFICSSLESGMCFVDTMNLDGETNLKEKMITKETMNISKETINFISGELICDKPNENLEKWECVTNLKLDPNYKNLQLKEFQFICGLKQLLLKGCILKNTEYVYGIVVYTGPDTKIMRNSKSPPIKMSNVMKVMNKLLYSVFVFQFLLCIFFSIGHIIWEKSQGVYLNYLKIAGNNNNINAGSFFIRALTFLVAYSHLIPISLYVSLEIFKIIQGKLISKDLNMIDIETNKSATARTSDLIEELGQVEFVFSDKTGTLTKNEMEFIKCSIDNKIYTKEDFIKINENPNLMSSDEKNKIQNFFTLMAVCHSAYVEEDEKNDSKGNVLDLNLKYQSSSPDEIALIQGASKLGYRFIKKTARSIEILTPTNEHQIWELIMELPFDSTRKRMSIIVKLQGQTQYFLFTKGADTAMLGSNMIYSTINEEKIIKENLFHFAKEGLRTLVMAKKTLTENLVNDHLSYYNKILLSTDKDKESLLREFYNQIEKDFYYVGSSAIEDKLQDEVPETIESLMKSGIRVWVLTGDKKETAIEIGKSCRLVLDSSIMEMIDLASSSESDVSLSDFSKKLYNYYYYLLKDEITLGTAISLRKNLVQPKNISKSDSKNKKGKKLFLIIDGKNLAYVLNDAELSKMFFQIGVLANSVICCRVSPKQKSQVVKLAKSNGKWITLSIGDGANDVSMIMEAHIGVGISGKEGTQAVRSADYAISQFKFLKRLLFVHGRLGYRRISLFICYYFYKNIILVFTELYFAIYNGFSGQIFFPDMLPLCYNSFWTSWPPIFCYSLEKDADDIVSMNFPILYKAGQIGFYFNLTKFWEWIIFAILHGVLTFYSTLISVQYFNSVDGLTKSHWFSSTVAFSVIIHIVNYKIFIELKNWNRIVIVVSLISFLFYYFSLFVMCVPKFAYIFNNELAVVIFDILTYFKSWIIISLLPFIALLPDFFYYFIKYNFYPNPSDKIFNKRNLFKSLALDLDKKNKNYNKVKIVKKSRNFLNKSSSIIPLENFTEIKKDDISIRSKVSNYSFIEEKIGIKPVDNNLHIRTPKNEAKIINFKK